MLKFEKETARFGTVKEGTQATHEFNFTNTGNAPVVISDVKASCGCTTPDFTKTTRFYRAKRLYQGQLQQRRPAGSLQQKRDGYLQCHGSQQILFIKGNVEAKPE